MVVRADALGCEIVRLKANRLSGLSGEDQRRAYVDAKNTLASFLPGGIRYDHGSRRLNADWIAQFQVDRLIEAGYAVVYLGEPE